jgi:hypothetical protein
MIMMAYLLGESRISEDFNADSGETESGVHRLLMSLLRSGSGSKLDRTQVCKSSPGTQR